MYQFSVAWFYLLSLVGFTCLSCVIDDSCNLWLAPTIFKFSPASRRPLRQRTLPHPQAEAAGLAGGSILLFFILSRVGRSVRAVPGLSPAGPVAARLSSPVWGNVTMRDSPTCLTVENALRTSVLGSVSAYGRRPGHSPPAGG